VVLEQEAVLELKAAFEWEVALEQEAALEVYLEPKPSLEVDVSELTGFNPVELKLRKSVRFPSDEFVDVAIVKRIPKVLFLHRKILPFGVFIAQQL
jgi:hypothetical protein